MELNAIKAKRAFKLAQYLVRERGSLDAIIEQVPSNNSRKVLIPIIDKHCLDGTIFCSDGWKAYDKLKEHIQLNDCLHFPVNH